MWFILFLFPSYPNLNYKIEPSPTLSFLHLHCVSSKIVESPKLAASVQYCCSLVFGGVFLLQSYFGKGSLAAVHTLFLPVAVDYAMGAATCCLRVPWPVKRVPWPVKKVPLAVRKVPPPVEGTADCLRVQLSMVEGAAACGEVTLAARSNFWVWPLLFVAVSSGL